VLGYFPELRGVWFPCLLSSRAYQWVLKSVTTVCYQEGGGSRDGRSLE
jgi:hypothetical protein